MKAYYYYVSVSPAVQRGALYFKAGNKRVIKDYLKRNYTPYDRIFDPSDTPSEGVHYIDLTATKFNSNKSNRPAKVSRGKSV